MALKLLERLKRIFTYQEWSTTAQEAIANKEFLVEPFLDALANCKDSEPPRDPQRTRAPQRSMSSDPRGYGNDPRINSDSSKYGYDPRNYNPSPHDYDSNQNPFYSGGTKEIPVQARRSESLSLSDMLNQATQN